MFKKTEFVHQFKLMNRKKNIAERDKEEDDVHSKWIVHA